MEITEDVFLKDVADHAMKVVMDQGLYRHLLFRSPKTSNQYFEIVTFPGTLVYVGDMGSFVFQRIEDMFQFFRSRGDKNIAINPSYWSEKLEAVDNHTTKPGHKTYSEEKLKVIVQETVAEWCQDGELTAVQREELERVVKYELSFGDGEEDARRSVRDFSHEIDGHKFEFHDSWEWDCREYTGRFLWCCYAVVWAIREYDAYKQVAANA